MSAAIPAPGFRTFHGKSRPHLVTEALREVQRLHRLGEKVDLQAVAVLCILCDLVEASHGQFYGSWENLTAGYRWSRRTWFRWLAHLESVGLVENLGRLEGRRTTTWQMLPRLYRLCVSPDTQGGG